MPCSPANEPSLIETTDFIFPPSEFERRFLTGWWTRGVVPADNFTITNWSGLIIPEKIIFEENEILIEYPGRWWDDGVCRRSMPKVTLRIQYLCKGGRLYLHTEVWYGKDYSQQTYAGHNGAQKFRRVPLEKCEDSCSIEKQAGIPLAKADVIELKHIADWLVTIASAPGILQVGQPNLDWTLLFADYTEEDLSWRPCDGCIFPSQNWSVPEVLSEDNMIALEARLAAQNVKALFDTIVLNTIPETFNVPLCLHNTYLEVSLPDFSSVMHMREFFNSDIKQYFTDEYRTISVTPADVIKCFDIQQQPQNWPAPSDPKWEDDCPANMSETCGLSVNYTTTVYEDRTARPASGFVSQGGQLCSGGFTVSGNLPGATQAGEVTVVTSTTRTKRYNAKMCVLSYGYSGPPEQVVTCTQVVSYTQTILKEKKFADNQNNKIGLYIQSVYNANSGWNCNSSFVDPDSGSPPPQPNIPPDNTPQGPNGNGDCYFEGELIYVLNLDTILGSISYDASIPVRAKLPQGTTDLGAISGSINGTNLTVSTGFGGSFTIDLNAISAGFNAIGNAIASIIPVSFGLRNTRILCP